MFADRLQEDLVHCFQELDNVAIQCCLRINWVLRKSKIVHCQAKNDWFAQRTAGGDFAFMSQPERNFVLTCLRRCLKVRKWNRLPTFGDDRGDSAMSGKRWAQKLESKHRKRTTLAYTSFSRCSVTSYATVEAFGDWLHLMNAWMSYMIRPCSVGEGSWEMSGVRRLILKVDSGLTRQAEDQSISSFCVFWLRVSVANVQSWGTLLLRINFFCRNTGIEAEIANMYQRLTKQSTASFMFVRTPIF